MAQQPTWERRPSGAVMPGIMALPEAPSQTYKKGAYLTLDASGRVIQALSADNNLGATTASINNTANRVIGQADQDAAGVTGGLVQVSPLRGVQYLISVYSSTPSSAIATTADIGKSFGIRYCAGVNGGDPFFALNLDDATNIKATIIDMQAGSGGQNFYADLGLQAATTANAAPTVEYKGYATAAGTDQYAWVWVEFLANYSLGMGGSYS